MSADPTFVIIGAGQAGAWVARTLRSEGFSGRILLIGDEPYAPYERPPLSKSFLSGTSLIEEATLLDAARANSENIQWIGGDPAIAIDRATRVVRCQSGAEYSYDKLFLTMGSKVRKLPVTTVGKQQRVHYIRTLSDAVSLREALGHSKTIAVIGGGWIGLEVAATVRGLGLDVTVIEAAPRLCERSVPQAVSEYLARLHAERGVDVRLGVAVREICELPDGVEITLDDAVLRADQLVVGIGIVPEVDIAASAGLKVDNGVVVDERCQTSDPNIFAAGDVTNHPCMRTGTNRRLESWANAQNQAIVAAKAVLGQDVCYTDIPWAWSDQYDVNLQILGQIDAAASIVLRGDTGNGSCCWLLLDDERLPIGAVAVNAPRELRTVRKAMGGPTRINPDKWSDTNCALSV